MAARLVAEEKAELATPEEAAQFRADTESAWKASQQEAALSEAELRELRSSLKVRRRA